MFVCVWGGRVIHGTKYCYYVRVSHAAMSAHLFPPITELVLLLISLYMFTLPCTRSTGRRESTLRCESGIGCYACRRGRCRHTGAVIAPGPGSLLRLFCSSETTANVAWAAVRQRAFFRKPCCCTGLDNAVVRCVEPNDTERSGAKSAALLTARGRGFHISSCAPVREGGP